VTLAEGVVKDYLTVTKSLQKKLRITGDLSISDIVGLPNVLVFRRESMSKSFETSIVALVKRVTDQVIATRKAEGKRLAVDLKKRLSLCVGYIDAIKKRFDVFMKEKKEDVKNLLILGEI